MTVYIECSRKCHPHTWNCVVAHTKIAVCKTQVFHKVLNFINSALLGNRSGLSGNDVPINFQPEGLTLKKGCSTYIFLL
jgi:hypothetical protein